MTFQPRMNNRISGFDQIGTWNRRVFNGAVADLWDVQCARLAGGSYVADAPRLFAVLETTGDPTRSLAMASIGAGTARRGESDRPGSPCRRLSYIPAGMELQAELEGIRAIRHLDLHFDISALGQRMGSQLDPFMIEQPRLMFADPRLLALADLLAAECADPDPLHDLYGDGLALGLFIALMRVPPSGRRLRGALAPWQLRRATDFIETHCLRGIRLEELADLTGLSQSHFSQAFKASTGMPPHQWQMKARIERAKTLLVARTASLSEVAAITGFADQAHFTRAFRKMSGTTPGRWLRGR
ncbi:AraC family transcriptional regulator [Rhizobium sp. PP-F2F-G48]|uniref:helix-turn-helix domain-containing protein n=1 Tax=Rhizobium sp. PP-F2F-G48 TaxID=2135651 RepID=UPI001043F399|nr:AraC family transcriptional regulator [Rhizobium sp. PP-F2F-G48]TCM54431.1 AraC family transcriptional regulator [Rhizobium sp. PP-F2F-G48]